MNLKGIANKDNRYLTWSANIQSMAFSKYANDTKIEWKDATGATLKSNTGIGLVQLICNGMALPDSVSDNLFNKVVNISYATKSAKFHNNETSLQTMGLAGMPMKFIVNEYVDQVIDNPSQSADSGPLMVIHSIHDSSIITLLESMGPYVFDGVHSSESIDYWITHNQFAIGFILG